MTQPLVTLNEAIRLDPKDAEGHSNQGLAWHSKGDFDPGS